MVQKLMKDMGGLLLLSMLIIYIILAIQFESLKYPLLIILGIPFAWAGALLSIWLTGVGLNALSFMGILILTGIAVKDRKSTRLNSSHVAISYAVFCLKKKKIRTIATRAKE